MSTEANKILVRRLIEEVWNTGTYEQLDVLAAPALANRTYRRPNGSTSTVGVSNPITCLAALTEMPMFTICLARWSIKPAHSG